MANLDDDAVAEVRESVREALAPFASQDGALQIPASAIVASARA